MATATRRAWHKLLERQLKRQFGDLDDVPHELRDLFQEISDSYEQADSDRRLVEHSLELASQELLQRNADLRAKQHEQQIIFDSVPALIIYKDTQNRILRLNESAARALGGSAAELEGKASEEVLPPELARQLHADDLEVIRSGQPKLGIIESHPTADGQTRWMRTDKVPFRDADGKVVGVIVFSVDITERRMAEAKLRDSEERYRLIVETATEGIWTLDAQGRTTFANEVMARMLGYTRDEMAGRHVFDFIPADDLPVAQQKLAALMGGTTLALDFRFRRKDGTDLWTQASGAPMLGPDGKVVGALGMLTDITQRKSAEAELSAAYSRLQQVDKERMQFLNNAAHELSTPLTPIKLQMRLLQMETVGSPAAKQVSILERNFDRLAHLVKDLLDAARLQAASLRLHRQRFDLASVVYQSIETYLPAAREAGVELVVDDDLPPLQVDGDTNRISQVLDNLVSNALKFTSAGGQILIDLGRRGDRAVVTVRDTGAGMRPSDVNRLFKPFSQVHDTMQQTRGGTGLGLYISRGILEAHGGIIEAHSDGPGHGSLFRFELPIAPLDDGDGGEAAAAQA